MNGAGMKEKQAKNRFLNKQVIFSTIAIIILVGASVFIWFLQQQKIDDLSKQKNAISNDKGKVEKELSAQKGSNMQLKKQVDELNQSVSKLQSPQQAKLSITLNEAKHNGIIYNETGNDMVFVDITVTNTSKSLGGYFAPSSLMLKDGKTNSVYPLCQNSAVGYYVCRTGLNVPNGKAELVGQSIPSGQTVRGTVGFYAPKDLKSANLLYDGASFEVNIQNS